MKNALLSLMLLAGVTLFGQVDQQAFAEELGPQVDRTLILKNCSGDTDDLIFNRMVFQPEYSNDFIVRSRKAGITSAFYERYGYIGDLPENGQLEYGSVTMPYQLILMNDEHGFMAYQAIEFSATEETREICIDDYWYQTNTQLLVDQLLKGELEYLNIRAHQHNKKAGRNIEPEQNWTLTRTGTQVSLKIKKGEEIIREEVVNEAFLQGLKDWEIRVRQLAELPRKKKPRGPVETFILGNADFFIQFGTNDTEAFEIANLKALLNRL